ncbi:MAG: terpene synthase family protein [Streptosporangiaceae bacterium]
MDATLLLPLTECVPGLAVPCRIHEEIWQIGEDTGAWARNSGLVLGDPDTTRLGRGRFGRMAARIFPEAPADRVVLFAKWLTWLFAFDDARDEGPLGGSATAIDALYSDLWKAVRRRAARPGAGPLELALAELWRESAAEMGSDWRRRFTGHLDAHRAGCLEEAVNRRTGSAPALEDYPLLRRRTNGLFMFDLAEPVLGVEVPESVAVSRAWLSLVDGTSDVMAWCNDVASFTQDSDPCNYVIVAMRSLGLTAEAAVNWVNERILVRAQDVQAAARSLPAEFTRLRVDPVTVREVSRLVCGLLGAPRAHLDWLLECGRYKDPALVLPPRPAGQTLSVLLPS